jgi:acetoin:2,6-dichlorophenolindophenol oxidoreductase subunit beta
MARTITYREAINEALAQEMARDPSVVVMGEDNAGGAGSPGEEDAWGGVLGVTKGLYHQFPGRVLDTPISESAFIGAAVGAATSGLRPVAELMFIDFMGVCFDQIFNQAAKFRYMFGGKAVTPVVVRTMYGAGLRAAALTPPLPGPVPDLHPHPRAQGGRAVQPLRGQGSAHPVDP